MSRGARGFTAIELAIVLAIGTILVPLIYAYVFNLEDRTDLARFELDVADAVRTISEELHRDARAGRVPGESLAFRAGACTARYAVEGGVLQRRLEPRGGGSCPPHRGLARGVEGLTVVSGGVEVTFGLRLRVERVHRTTVFVPLREAK